MLNLRTESAPLLRGGDDDPPQSAQSRSTGPSMSRRIANVVHEPLTSLTKVLLVEVLILLLISSVFIGLFAGAQHKLNLRNGVPGGGGGGGGNATQTKTKTATITHTTTAAPTITTISGTLITTTAVSTALSTVFDPTTTTKIATTTATKTSVSTSISTFTTTDVHTRTVIVGPEPTGPPEDPSPAPSPAPSVCLVARVLSRISPLMLTRSASLRIASSWLHPFYRPWTNHRILAKISMTLRVSRHVVVPCLLRCSITVSDGGWIASHPVPGDKGAVNSFSVLSEQNAQVILKILEGDSSIQDNSWDDQLLRKIRVLYTSCMDEARLEYLGQEPLQKFVNTIRKLYRGKTTSVDIMNPRQGLSNALGYLHSRGKLSV